MSVPEELLTPVEVAQSLKVGVKWIMDHITRYEPIIPHVRMGRAIRFRLDAPISNSSYLRG